MNTPEDLKYTKNDEWIRVEDGTGTIGITDHAQDQLSDIVFVEIVVSAGDKIEKGATIATLESVKAAADVYSPVSGEVVEVNEALPDSPELVNSDPYGEAWMIKIKVENTQEIAGLMDSAAYAAAVEQSE